MGAPIAQGTQDHPPGDWGQATQPPSPWSALGCKWDIRHTPLVLIPLPRFLSVCPAASLLAPLASLSHELQLTLRCQPRGPQPGPSQPPPPCNPFHPLSACACHTAPAVTTGCQLREGTASLIRGYKCFLKEGRRPAAPTQIDRS